MPHISISRAAQILAAVTAAAVLVGLGIHLLGTGQSQDPDKRGPARILIVGDSLAQGSAGDYTWRYRLWTKLTATAHSQVSFVGPRSDLYDPVNAEYGSQAYAVAFDATSHGARWGDTYAREVDNIGEMVKSSRANVLVVMLGGNDLAYASSPADTVKNLATYVDRARAAAPGIDILVAAVPDRYNTATGQDEFQGQITEFARLLGQFADQVNSRDQRVVVARTRDGWDARTDTWDGTHPNPTGENLLAQRVSEALAEIGVGAAVPDISAVVPWSVAGPQVELKAGPGSVALKWDRTSTGATGMFIERRAFASGDGWVRTPYAAGGDSWTAKPLEPGQTYEFRLVPAKGSSTGLPGPSAMVELPR